MSVTIKDVARRAGVDKRTVSRVINNQPYVRDAVRVKVQAAIAELGFAPNSAAQRLRFRCTFTIAVAIAGTAPDFIAATLLSTTRVATAKGYAVVVVQFDPRDPQSLAWVADLARRKQADGLIVTGPAEVLEARLGPLLPARFPWVHFGRASEPRDLPSVSAEGTQGAYAMAEHLLQLGHRRIGYVSGADLQFMDRLAGFAAALGDNGIPLDPQCVVVQEELSFASGLGAGRTLLALRPRPTAICAGNDAAAAGVLAAGYEVGIRVPQDLSVTGFDDFPLAQQTLPALTTIRLPLDEISRIACEMLIDLIQGKRLEEPHVAVPVSLVIRDSTGPCRGL